MYVFIAEQTISKAILKESLTEVRDQDPELDPITIQQNQG